MSPITTTPRITRTVRRLIFPAILAVIGTLVFGFAAPAQADNASQIAAGLSHSHLYVSSEARPTLSTADQAEVENALANAKDTDIRVVVTKAVANTGSAKRALLTMLQNVQSRVGKGDTYLAVTADDKITGISKKFSGTELNQLITQANPGADIKTRLIALAGAAETKAKDKSSSSALAGFAMLGLAIVVVAGALGLFLVARRRRLEREAKQMAELKQNVQEDVTLLGEDIAALDLKVTDPDLPAEIRNDYAKALDSYDSAKTATEKAQRPEDMTLVTKALEDGRYYMTAVRARLAGQPVPERRAPCFFNPQHGPSVQDVSWAPLGGMPRPVPACAADAAAVLRGENPDARMVYTDGGRRPYWEAGPAYAPYAGGYYSGFGGGALLGGLLIGTALGSMWGGGYGGGWGGGGWGDDGFGGGGFGGDSGDAGGGWDFGSGDFGGGGGDFGGGDW